MRSVLTVLLISVVVMLGIAVALFVCGEALGGHCGHPCCLRADRVRGFRRLRRLIARLVASPIASLQALAQLFERPFLVLGCAPPSAMALHEGIQLRV